MQQHGRTVHSQWGLTDRHTDLDEEYFSPAYGVGLAHVVGHSVDLEALNAIQGHVVHRRLHPDNNTVNQC